MKGARDHGVGIQLGGENNENGRPNREHKETMTWGKSNEIPWIGGWNKVDRAKGTEGRLTA